MIMAESVSSKLTVEFMIWCGGDCSTLLLVSYALIKSSILVILNENGNLPRFKFGKS